MKHIKLIYLALLITMAGWLAGCSRAIDEDPSHTIDGSDFFTKIDDYEKSLLGVYARLLQDGYTGTSNTGANALVGLPDIMSDNLFESAESLGNYQDYSRWTYTADDASIADMWLDMYRIIQQVNLTLRGIDKLAVTNPGAVNRITAQAIAIRAMVHFDLLRYFGEAEARNSTAKGIAYVDKFDIEQKPARLNVKASYDRIEADLKTAKNLMLNMDRSIQGSGTGPGDRSYVDDMVINAILARMYLTSSELDSAVKYSTLVINARPLATRANFPNIWIDVTTSEVIWSIKFEAFNSPIGSVMYYSVGNRAEFRPTTNLLALYDQANDIRYPSYFRSVLRGANRNDPNRPARLVLIKHDAKQSSIPKPDGIVNFKAFRTGEMYLIRAEAYARLGGANEALGLADLNTLRNARISNYVPVVLTGAALLSAIETERRKELVGEGHRFLDLKRSSRTVVRLTNCASFCSLPPAAREWVFPIPQPEILANEAMEQNNGY
ncbi:MAG TPA: RagB/SusD family nutrient uptake outer membrane protein [Chitinophagaceae bacterium]|nr:RagB/SusD family nutrient uptake outer membrane protein [Chitinophagaceae bacterium]